MKISVYGLGYVGLVSAACLAEFGHELLCVDINESRVNQLCAGVIPIYEPGLEQLVRNNMANGRLRFTTNLSQAIVHSDVQMIAVGTPSQADGSVDLRDVFAVVRNIASQMTSPKLIINKSTVPVGTADRIKKLVNEVLYQRQELYEFDVASNPEFLKEGEAINDFINPDRIIIGVESEKAKSVLHEMYAPFNQDKLLVMNIRSAEFTKYAANAMLATKISFINEIANLAERLGADIEQIRQGIGSDSRIGKHFINPGCGFGGSCFPKDVNALIKISSEVGYESLLLRAVNQVNNFQKKILFEKLFSHFNGNLRGKTFAIWGLSFKPNTDDIREASSVVLISSLLTEGVKLQAFDPVAMPRFANTYPQYQNITYASTQEEALDQADALIICTEWSNFIHPNFVTMKQQLRQPVIFDGRNLYDPLLLQQLGFTYYGIGRGTPLKVEETQIASLI